MKIDQKTSKNQIQVDFQLHFVEDMSLFFVVMCPAHAFL